MGCLVKHGLLLNHTLILARLSQESVRCHKGHSYLGTVFDGLVLSDKVTLLEAFVYIYIYTLLHTVTISIYTI